MNMREERKGSGRSAREKFDGSFVLLHTPDALQTSGDVNQRVKRQNSNRNKEVTCGKYDLTRSWVMREAMVGLPASNANLASSWSCSTISYQCKSRMVFTRCEREIKCVCLQVPAWVEENGRWDEEVKADKE